MAELRFLYPLPVDGGLPFHFEQVEVGMQALVGELVKTVGTQLRELSVGPEPRPQLFGLMGRSVSHMGT